MSQYRSQDIRALTDVEYTTLFLIHQVIARAGIAVSYADLERQVQAVPKIGRRPITASLEFLFKMGWIVYGRNSEGLVLENHYTITPTGGERLVMEQKRREGEKAQRQPAKSKGKDDTDADPTKEPKTDPPA